MLTIQEKEPTSIYSLQFVLLCFSGFLFSASFTMMLPELPKYLSSLGGAEYKGLILALFTLTAGFSRPFSGKLTDTIGRVPVMAFGSLVCFLCGFFYPILTSVSGFLWLRLIHGFSTGFKPTGTAAYIADITPSNRRGEAIGIQGISSSIGMSIGPTIGSLITDHSTINTMFYTSSVFALLSIAILMGMKETLKNKVKFHPKLLKISKEEVFEPLVLAPFIVMFLVSYASGAILTIAPDLSEHVGLKNKGLFFTVYTVSSLSIRLFAGKASDRLGRIPVMKVSIVILAGSLVILGFADSPAILMVGAVIYGISWGINTPTLNAWSIDLSHVEYRGRAIATVSIGLEFGIMMGAWFSGWLYHNKPQNFGITFFAAAFLAIVSLIYILLVKTKKPSFVEINEKSKI